MLRDSIAGLFREADPQSLGTHVGLWIDKMLPEEEASSAVAGRHLRKIIGAPVPDGYALAFGARHALFTALADRDDALLLEARTTSRLIIGLGAKGVLEMGITLDRTWGTPYLPGSALKGLCAAAAHKLAVGEGWQRFAGWPEAPPDDPENPSDYQILFGTTAGEGAVIFHDAWWDPNGASVLPVEMDVMTVHHPGYYQADPDRVASPPSDLDEPVPVPFLSLSTSGRFLIALEGPKGWCRAAAKLLREAMVELGAGAKTSSGYGRMTVTEVPSEAQRNRRERLEQLQAQLRGYKPGNKDAAIRALVRAIEARVQGAEVGDALRSVEKGHRVGLVDAARALLDSGGSEALDAAVASLTPASAPSPKAPVAPPQAPPGQQEVRRRRARLAPDPKSPKRFFIHLEGEEKALRGGAVEIDPGLLEELRASGDWVDVVVHGRTGKVKIERA